MNQLYDIAVIGAGVAGSSLAKAMADRGWRTVLIDRQAFPRHKVCGEFLSPESQGILCELGLLEPVRALAPSTIERARLVLPRGGGMDIPLPGTALGVSRYALDTALHQASGRAGAEVLTGTTVTSVKPMDGAGYTVETRQGGRIQSLQARAVVAAWGIHPRLSLHESNPDQGRKSSNGPVYVGVKSHFAEMAMEPVVELYFIHGGYVGISPVGDGRVNICALLKQDTLQEGEKDKSILGILMQAAKRNPLLLERLSGGVPVPGTQAAVAPVQLSRRPLPWGDYAHVGDAALMVPPLCGDGMSMALRSALLCAKLADSYLSGEIQLAEWRRLYTQSITLQFSGPLRWGRLLHSLSDIPVLPGLFMNLAKLAPPLARGLVHATRLKETGR